MFKKVLIIVLLLSIIAGFTACYGYERYDPDTRIIPLENACNYYIKAETKLADYWRDKSIQHVFSKDDVFNNNSAKSPSKAELKYLNKFKGCIYLLMNGVQCSYSSIHDVEGADSFTGALDALLFLPFLLNIQIRQDFATGNRKAAIQHFRAGMKYLRDVGQDWCLNYNNSVDDTYLVVQPLAQRINQLSAEECEQLAKWLRSWPLDSVFIREMIRNDWRGTIVNYRDDLREGQRDSKKLDSLFDTGLDEAPGSYVDNREEAALRKIRRRFKLECMKAIKTDAGFETFCNQVQAYYEARMNKTLGALDKPVWQWPVYSTGLDYKNGAVGYLGRCQVPSNETINAQTQDATQKLLYLHLRLRAYKLRTGKYPQKLEDLGKAMMIDPFTGKPFPYRLVRKSYKLYSVGPNKVDDGGKVLKENQNDSIPNDLFLLPDGKR